MDNLWISNLRPTLRNFFYGSRGAGVQGEDRRLLELGAAFMVQINPPHQDENESHQDDHRNERSDAASHDGERSNKEASAHSVLSDEC
jgi:hypothetical protein